MSDGLEIVAKLGGMLLGAGLSFALLYFAAVRHFRERLKGNGPYRIACAEDLRRPHFTRLYESWLDGALKALRLLMGAPWSPRAFGVCITLGLAYSFIFLIASWGFFGGSSRFGVTPLLPDFPSVGRFIFTAATLLYLFGSLYAYWYLGFWAARRRTRVTLLAALIGAVFCSVSFMLAGASALGVAIIFFGSEQTALAMVGVQGLGIASLTAMVGGAFFVVGGVRAAIVVFAVAGPMVAVVAMPRTLFGGLEIGRDQGLAILWIILPISNALWDWVSWGVSRLLGHHLLRMIRLPGLHFVRKAWAGLWHIVLDLALAIAFLVLLARTLPWAVGKLDSFVVARGGRLLFQLTDYLCDAAREPWTTGLWVTLMLLSTLVPTALHATAALASPLAVGAFSLQHHDVLAARLETVEVGCSEFDAVIDDSAAHLAWTWIAVWTVAATLITAAFLGLLWLFNLFTSELPAPLLGSLREGLLAVALWDVEAAKACLAAPMAGTG